MIGKDSIGIDIAGHEQVCVSEICVYASIPIRIDRCPVIFGSATRGWLSSDHFNFNNITLGPGGPSCAPSANGGSLPHASVYFADGTDLSQVSFTGRQAWVGGKYGVYLKWDTPIRIDRNNGSSS